jgi:ABC-type transport system involved in Fe-S cluster assembly fused permease/ATPase subunit
MAEGRTMIIVSHRLSTLRGAHRTMIVERGSIQDVARHGERVQRSGIYRDLWELQTQSLR